MSHGHEDEAGPSRREPEQPRPHQPDVAVDADLKVRLERILADHAQDRRALVPVLLAAQAELGWLPGPVLHFLARALGVSATQVYEVVSFYSFFTTRPAAEHQLKVCLGTTCFVSQATRVLRAFEQTLGITAEGVTEDGRFGLGHTRCLGACSVAPAVTVDGRVLGGLTPSRATTLAERLKARKRPGPRDPGSRS